MNAAYDMFINCFQLTSIISPKQLKQTAYMKTIILSFRHRNSLNITIYAISCLSKMSHDLYTKNEKIQLCYLPHTYKDLSQYRIT